METVFCLMQDGTIEYPPLSYKYIKSLDLKSADDYASKINFHTTISEVEDVVTLARVSAGPVGQTTGGNMAVTGIKKDGSFYNLSK